jgi:hypothetical protein
MHGWICPRCGRSLAPWKDSCECSGAFSLPIVVRPNFVPWPGYPSPYIGDLPGFDPVITCRAGTGS